MRQTAPEPIYRGKVRDTYDLGDDLLLMVASDRISVFDVILNETVPGKGVVLAHMTKHWFTQTPVGTLAPIHYVEQTTDDLPRWTDQFAERSMVVRKAQMLPVEFIVRGYITGSAWTSYLADGTVNGITMPRGLEQMQPFPTPMFTPSTKAALGQHDENISIAAMVELLGDKDLANEAIGICLDAYSVGSAYALERGIVLVDTKFELGVIDGHLALCDEILTPDSSRYVATNTLTLGEPPKSMDKEYVRSWAKSTGWNKQPPPPEVPDDVIDQTRLIYGDIAQRLTGVNPLSA